MLPIGVRIKVRSVSNARKRSSVAVSGKKSLNSSTPKLSSRTKKNLPPPKKFLRTSKERAEKLAKKQAKKEAAQEHQYHVLSRLPAWADDPGEFYGIYGSYYYHKQQQKQEIKETESEMSETRRLQIQEEQSKALNAHRRWLKKNKVTDAVSSKLPGRLGKNSQTGKVVVLKPKDDGAAILLYVGVSLVIVGLIVTMIGAGVHTCTSAPSSRQISKPNISNSKPNLTSSQTSVQECREEGNGFKSPELQMVGPTLIGMGIFFCLLRILTCTFRERCAKCCPSLCPPFTPAETPQTQPTVVATKARPKKLTPRRIESPPPPPTPPLAGSPKLVSRFGGIKMADDKSASRSTLPQKTSVSFENEVSKTSVANDTNKATDGDSDFDLSEFEEVELDSPKTSQASVKVRKKSLRFFGNEQLPSEIVLDPSKLVG